MTSPYKFAKMLSNKFNKSIPPQMIYNYIKKGYIQAETNELGKLFITNEECERFIEKYETRMNERNAQIQNELNA